MLDQSTNRSFTEAYRQFLGSLRERLERFSHRREHPRSHPLEDDFARLVRENGANHLGDLAFLQHDPGPCADEHIHVLAK
jgi:hypothetical protein